MTLQPYIDLGWHTVPLSGKAIIRVTEDNHSDYSEAKIGDKVGFSFTKNWKEKFTQEFNLLDTPIGGVLTEPSGIVAIDLDDQKTFDMFRALDPNNPWVWPSKDKPSGGGTLVYLFKDTLPPTFTDNMTEDIKIEFYSDSGFVYLPTAENYSKEPFIIPDTYPPEMPQAMENLLHVLYMKRNGSGSEAKGTGNTSLALNNYMRLQPLVNEAVRSEKYLPKLFKIITPKRFRNEKYRQQGHLHPNDISDGSGSDYIYSIATILATDVSVSPSLFEDAIRYINNLWNSPMPERRLEQTVIKPMVTGQAKADGKSFWQYDPDWRDASLVLTAKNGDNWEIVFDDERVEFYFINHSLSSFRAVEMSKAASLGSSLFGSMLKKKTLDDRAQIVRMEFEPKKPWGYDDDRGKFNLFIQLEPLSIINNPNQYAERYKEPSNFIEFMKEFIPNDADRSYILRFIRTKFTTFDYSPVIPYFVGVQGSGKNTLLDILSKFVGESTIVEVSKGEIMGDFNGFLQDKFFVQINELSKMVKSDHKAKDYIYGKLKLWTGNHSILIRSMRTNHFSVRNLITFILTDNESPLSVEVGDRRIYLVNTPNPMATAQWVKKHDDIRIARDKLFGEINDIAYYLAVNFTNLAADDYTTAPTTSDKEEMIVRSLPYSARIVYHLQKNNFDALLESGINPEHLFDIPKARVWEQGLVEIYKLMGGQHDDPTQIVAQAVKEQIGYKRKHTTIKGENTFYYEVPALRDYQFMNQVL